MSMKLPEGIAKRIARKYDLYNRICRVRIVNRKTESSINSGLSAF